jgi:hypothetical protein
MKRMTLLAAWLAGARARRRQVRVVENRLGMDRAWGDTTLRMGRIEHA